MKRFVLGTIAKNVYLNKSFYNFVCKKSDIYIRKIVGEFHEDDYLDDTQSLKIFRENAERSKDVFVTRNINWNNTHIYGIWESVFGKVVKNEKFISPCIEHGLIFHNEVYRDVLNTARMTCATFSSFRKEIIQSRVEIPVFCVGSYIKYADNFYIREKLDALKNRMGKTLLVFPTHSTDNSEITTNQELFCKNLKSYAREFDTVLINAFWWNINDPLIQRLESEGYKIISCGFRDDTNFLPRLKSYFELADLVMGDSIGTHVGYALACGVPFSYVPAETKTKLLLECENKDIDFVEMHQNKIAEAFLNATEITDKQREIVDYYWGNNLFKTKEEIKAIVEINREITDMTYGFTDFRWSAAKKLLKKYADTDEVKYKLLKDAL